MPNPILFEALPPAVGSTEASWRSLIDQLSPLSEAKVRVVVPEVLDGAYQTVEPRRFAGSLQRNLGIRAAVNRITVHHAEPALSEWAQQIHAEDDIKDLVLVGGESSSKEYSGQSVTSALRSLSTPVAQRGGSLGVITIPTRRRPFNDEPARLLAKQQAGATYAVSQILCESGSATKLQTDFAREAHRSGASPIPIFWSLAPVAKRRDVDFLRWLGVQIPPSVAQRLVDATDPAARLRISHDLNLALARDILVHTEANGGGNVGFCIEHVMQGNVPAALELLFHVRDLASEFRRQLAAPLAAAT